MLRIAIFFICASQHSQMSLGNTDAFWCKRYCRSCSLLSFKCCGHAALCCSGVWHGAQGLRQQSTWQPGSKGAQASHWWMQVGGRHASHRIKLRCHQHRLLHALLRLDNPLGPTERLTGCITFQSESGAPLEAIRGIRRGVYLSAVFCK